MIKEITRVEVERRFHVFPKIRFGTLDSYNGMSSLNLETHVEVDGYLTCLRKQFDYKTDDKLDYVQLMKFVDSIQPDVNKVKKNFDHKLYETNTVVGIYKIIE